MGVCSDKTWESTVILSKRATILMQADDSLKLG
jgi:hypothetical protein